MATRETRHKEVVRRRKKREKRQRAQSILEAATKVFLAKGYTKTTMDDIALEAEITKPTIYQYFETKEQLYFSLMAPFIEELGSGIEKIEKEVLEGGYETGASLVRDMFRNMYGAYRTYPHRFRIVQFFQQSGRIWEMSDSVSSSLNEKGKRNFERIRRVLALGIEQGLLKDYNVYQLTDVLWGLFVGVVQLSDVKSYRTSRSPAANRTDRNLEASLELAEKLVTDAVALS
ncbi:MAG: TetR/AcrR family transcriptional regulator [Thermodesulfobacteriota bacterium]